MSYERISSLDFYFSCKEQDQATPGCSQVSGCLPLANVQVDIDSDREIEKLHALLLNNMDKLEAMQGDILLYNTIFMFIMPTLYIDFSISVCTNI